MSTPSNSRRPVLFASAPEPRNSYRTPRTFKGFPEQDLPASCNGKRSSDGILDPTVDTPCKKRKTRPSHIGVLSPHATPGQGVFTHQAWLAQRKANMDTVERTLSPCTIYARSSTDENMGHSKQSSPTFKSPTTYSLSPLANSPSASTSIFPRGSPSRPDRRASSTAQSPLSDLNRKLASIAGSPARSSPSSNREPATSGTDSPNPFAASFRKQLEADTGFAIESEAPSVDISSVTHFQFPKYRLRQKNSAQLSNDIFHLIRKKAPVSNLSEKYGWLYAAYIPGRSEYKKIGVTDKQTYGQRVAQLLNKCHKKYIAEPMESPAFAMDRRMLFFERLEALVHRELWNHRVQATCRCVKAVKAKDQTQVGRDTFLIHGTEWFEISDSLAMEVVVKWRTFMSLQPYDEHTGVLKDDYMEWLDHCEGMKAEASERLGIFLADLPQGQSQHKIRRSSRVRKRSK